MTFSSIHENIYFFRGVQDLIFSSIHENISFSEGLKMKRRKAALVTMIAEEELTTVESKSATDDENHPWVIIDVGGDRFQARR